MRTNRCAISLTPVTERYLHVTSVTDNLRKGAAGQAVQDFNLMFGCPKPKRCCRGGGDDAT